ncbi:hypothetical protein M3Y94_00906200 [Aphelenchoides besseyi]|nr:hypothetical protein M3Y94_00906200 [Aphelenchoides besseyi]
MNRKAIQVHPKGIKKSAARHGEEEWLRMFQMMDHEEDGYIALREFQSAIRNSAEAWGVQAEVAEKLLQDVDKNNDQRVDFNEFCLMMAKANNMKMRRYVLYAAEWFTLKGKENKQTRYLLQYSCLPPPLFMLIITLMQIGAYFCYAYGEPLSPVGPIPFKSLFILNPERRTEQFWRYFTYMFIHIGFIHISLAIVSCKCFLDYHSKWYTNSGALELSTFAVSSVVHFLMSAADSNTYLGGASGGVYTLISAHISNVVINWSEIEFNWAHALVIGAFVTFDVAVAVYARYFNGPDKVSHTAHIGGFVAGLLLGIVLLRNLRLKKMGASCLVDLSDCLSDVQHNLSCLDLFGRRINFN